uniref:Uncharacterized protein n=1 Tax=Anguilla anguilla TaxID=7936 RepID=A0A0E9PJN4_ANGAN
MLILPPLITACSSFISSLYSSPFPPPMAWASSKHCIKERERERSSRVSASVLLILSGYAYACVRVHLCV